MELDNQIWLHEKNRLKKVLEIIDAQLNKSRGALDLFRKQAIRTQKSMWDEVNPTPSDLDDFANVWQYQVDIEREGRKAIFEGQQTARLERMRNSPYFGRIDFLEDDSDPGAPAEQIYIGISNLFDEKTSSFLIYDWRAPISSMFYDYETGRARYTCPAGIIEGEMTLKRQYRIWRGILEYMFDSSLKIDDEILQEILGKSADSKMRTIVTSIQREQNRVIRDDTNRLLVVQGAAGSGKTSIALHRAAYLLYRYKDSIRADNIAIFSPNQLFNDYISNVLPELGEENILRTTFLQYGRSVLGKELEIEDPNRQMEFILSSRGEAYGSARAAGIKLKASSAFTELIKKYAKHIEASYVFQDIKYRDELIEAASETEAYFRRDMASLPVSMRLEKIRNRLLSLLEPVMRKRVEELIPELADTGNFIDKEEMKAHSILLVREEMRPIKEQIQRMTSFNLIECYKDLFRNRELFRKLSGYGGYNSSCDFGYDSEYDSGNAILRVPENMDGIERYTLDALNTGRVYYEDLGPLLFLRGLLEGVRSRGDIKHVILDEVQDYTAAQFEVLNQLFAHCSITMLGDINQSINPYMNMGSYETITSIMGTNKAAMITLTRSYRSTKQITQFCRALLNCTDDTDYINREGDLPEVIVPGEEHAGGVGTPGAYENIYKLIADSVEEFSGKGCESIAVICRTERDCRQVYENTKEYLKARLLINSDEEFTTGKLIIPSYMAKGLEFDGVIVYDDGSGYKREEERRLFYTVCTRALHRLKIICGRSLTRFIESVDGELYGVRRI